jgi:tRNA isopentenyl-2-thiomethyl-A-37 hydroxylase MiaE
MMSSPAFDSLRFARRLKEAGVPDSQAEAQAELMAETFGFYVDNLVTRDYLDARLNARFAEQDATIDRRFSESEVRLEARFAQQDLYIEQRLSGLDVKLNVMAAMLAVIAASVVPIAISTLLAS